MSSTLSAAGVMTILTHHAASRQAAMAPYGKMLLARRAG
jgi:hypothetical protein